MTIHKVKGLDFAVVFLVGMVENILPSKRGNLEEERRICFVAISRAMKLLYLSHTAMMPWLTSPPTISFESLETMKIGDERHTLRTVAQRSIAWRLGI